MILCQVQEITDDGMLKMICRDVGADEDYDEMVYFHYEQPREWLQEQADEVRVGDIIQRIIAPKYYSKSDRNSLGFHNMGRIRNRPVYNKYEEILANITAPDENSSEAEKLYYHTLEQACQSVSFIATLTSEWEQEGF